MYMKLILGTVFMLGVIINFGMLSIRASRCHFEITTLTRQSNVMYDSWYAVMA